MASTPLEPKEVLPPSRSPLQQALLSRSWHAWAGGLMARRDALAQAAALMSAARVLRTLGRVFSVWRQFTTAMAADLDPANAFLSPRSARDDRRLVRRLAVVAGNTQVRLVSRCSPVALASPSGCSRDLSRHVVSHRSWGIHDPFHTSNSSTLASDTTLTSQHLRAHMLRTMAPRPPPLPHTPCHMRHAKTVCTLSGPIANNVPIPWFRETCIPKM